MRDPSGENCTVPTDRSFKKSDDWNPDASATTAHPAMPNTILYMRDTVSGEGCWRQVTPTKKPAAAILSYHPFLSSRRADFVGQVGRGTPWVRPIVYRPALWGSQSWLSSWAFGPPNGMKAHRSIVGQVANLRPVGNRPVATLNVFSSGCAGLSTVQPAFSRLVPLSDKSAR